MEYKFLKLILIVFSFPLLIGCYNFSGSELEMAKKIENLEKENKVLKEKIDTILKKENSVKKIEGKENYTMVESIVENYNTNVSEVYIKTISEYCYLVGYNEVDIEKINMEYMIYNKLQNSFVEIEPLHQFISDIQVVNGKINFYLDGRNSVNGFRDFPSVAIVEVDTGKISMKQNRYDVNDGYKMLVGNDLNESKITNVIIDENTLEIDFDTTNNSFLVGGEHYPNVLVQSQQRNEIVIEIENCLYNEEIIEIVNSTKSFDNFEISINNNENFKRTSIEVKLKNAEGYSFENIGDEDLVGNLKIYFYNTSEIKFE